jgi:hypothetical protein
MRDAEGGSTYRQRQWGANGWQLTAGLSIQEIEVRDSRRGGFLIKGKGGLVEYDITRDDDPIAGEIKTLISFVVTRIPQKDTQC